MRLTLSLGSGALDKTDSGTAWAWMTAAPAAANTAPIRMTLAPWRRDKESVLRGIKTGNYAEHLIALDMARLEGFAEMLFYNTENELCDAAMANVFLIRKGTLLTPGLDSGCLAGITRSLILHLAKQHRIPCSERTLNKADVAKADAIFLTSSVKGPVRVAALQGREFPPHPLVEKVRSLWLEEMARVEK